MIVFSNARRSYDIGMYVRPICIALAILALGGVMSGQCPKNPGASDAIQVQEQSGHSGNVVVREVHFANVNSGTVEEERQIADSLVGFCFPENKSEELDQRIRSGFQHFGFFKARIMALTIEVPDSASPPTVSVSARVEPGERYSLKGIYLFGDRAITNLTALRNLFPLQDYEIFDIEKVRKGLENLRDAYGNLGYINFVAVPETETDEENRLITLNIDLDEGATFVIRSFTINDVDRDRAAALRALWPEMLEPGKIYNARLIKVFFERAQQLLPNASPDKNIAVEQNSQENTVDIVLNTESQAN
jgi:outer membrane protein insertion porin family